MNIGYQPPPGAVYLPELDPLNQERAYTRVSYDGASCVMEPHEAAALVAEDQEHEYQLTEVRMTPNQFKNLPEFTGW